MSFNPGYNFNIYRFIHNHKGSATLKYARSLERKSIAIVRHRCHLFFNHTLKRSRILPESLKFTPPIQCNEGYKIAKKAGEDYLRLRISHGHNRIKDLEKHRSDLTTKLKEELEPIVFNELYKVIRFNANKKFEEVKAKHLNKLKKLGALQDSTHTSDYVDKDRWVINISNRTMSPTELQVLQQGLNFAVAPQRPPIPKIIAAIESSIFNLPQPSKDRIRSSVFNILKNPNTKKINNFTRAQNKAVKELKEDINIIIVPADKGKATVVMNRNEYKQKIMELLNDTNTYQKITDKRRNPTTRVEKDLNKLLMDLQFQRSEHDVTKCQLLPRLYLHLHSTDATPAAFYGLPKIHKPNKPLRPITSCVGSATYNLSKHLVPILSPLLNHRYDVKHSTEFSQRIQQHTICDDEVMVSFDVVSLFTSIPVDLALEITSKRLLNDANLTERTNISVDNILKLLEFVLRNSYFTFEGDHYQQIFGCAMGSPISATLANIVMEHVEDQALSTTQTPPKWWFRFVDDSHSCLKKAHVVDFHNHLNSINQHIQFTYELEENQCLPFLDTKTTRCEGRIIVDVYRKPTHTDKYLDFHSYHPIQHKRSVVNTLLSRAENVPTTHSARRKERKHIIKVLIDNNYPSSFIRTCDKARRNKQRDNTTGTETSEANSFVVLPYIRGTSEKLARVLGREGIRVAHKPTHTLNHRFPRPKDKVPPAMKKSVVYKINCKDCDFIYYGQTERALKTRIREHKKAVADCDLNSKLAQHANFQIHSFDFDNAAIVDSETNCHKRLFLEAWHSKKDKNSGNDHISIPTIYEPLMSNT